MAAGEGAEEAAAVRSRIMRAIKGKDTKPEMAVRRLAYSLGYRYRLHRRDLPGRPDLAFIGRRKAIFVHGCFWHQHAGCRAAHLPRSRPEYWGPKLARNVARDGANLAALEGIGWRVLVVWECEIKNASDLRERLVSFLSDNLCAKG